MTDITNADRAWRAAELITHYPDFDDDADEDICVDAVTDIMHLFHQSGWGSVDDLIRRATNHFLAELEEEA